MLRLEVFAALGVILIASQPAATQERSEAEARALPVCVGVAEGRFATIVEEGEQQPDTVRMDPILTGRQAGIRLVNRPQVSRALVRNYPPQLRNDGVAGMVVVAARVDENGSVVLAEVVRPSGYREFDVAARAVVRVMRFQPAVFQRCRIPALTRIPITFGPG
jgi:TonB family protein